MIGTLSCISHLSLSFAPLIVNSHLRLSFTALSFSSHVQLTCTSQLHLSHLNLCILPFMCTSQFHPWYATLTSALSCTSPWNIWFAIVDCKFSFAILIRASWLHSFLPRRCCTCHLHLSFATSSSALMGSCRSHLSVTTLIGTSRATSMCTMQLHRSVELVVRASCSLLAVAPVIVASHLILPVAPFS